MTTAVLLGLANMARADSDDLGSEVREGEPEMMSPLVAINVSPENSVTPFAPHWIRTPQGRTLGFGFGVEKMLSSNLDIEIDSSWDSVAPNAGPKESGFGAVEILSRYVFVNHPDLRLAVAPLLLIGTGGLGQVSGVNDVGMALLFGGRGGALPEDWNLGFLRAFEVHSDLGYSRITSGRGGDEIFFDPVLDYSLPYLQYLTESHLPWMIRNLCIFTELNFDAMVGGRESAAPTLYATPGLSYLTEDYLVSAGVQLPLNHAGEHTQQVAWLAQVQFFLDKIPGFGAMLL